MIELHNITDIADIAPLVGTHVAIQNKKHPEQVFGGQIVEIDTETGIKVRGLGRHGGEFVSNLDLVKTGIGENNRGSWRFFKLPLTAKAKEIISGEQKQGGVL